MVSDWKCEAFNTVCHVTVVIGELYKCCGNGNSQLTENQNYFVVKLRLMESW